MLRPNRTASRADSSMKPRASETMSIQEWVIGRLAIVSGTVVEMSQPACCEKVVARSTGVPSASVVRQTPGRSIDPWNGSSPSGLPRKAPESFDRAITLPAWSVTVAVQCSSSLALFRISRMRSGDIDALSTYKVRSRLVTGTLTLNTGPLAKMP